MDIASAVRCTTDRRPAGLRLPAGCSRHAATRQARASRRAGPPAPPFSGCLRVISFKAMATTEEAAKYISDVVLKHRVDLVGLQGCIGKAAQSIASVCGMQFAVDAHKTRAVLSRWPIEPIGSKLLAGHGYRVRLPSRIDVLWYNVHLREHPYAPYVLYDPLKFWVESPIAEEFQEMLEDALAEPRAPCARTSSRLGDGSPAAAELAEMVETETQLPDLTEVLADLEAHRPTSGLTLLTGSFSAASHLDYPAGPEWPCSRCCEAAGLTDSFDEARRHGVAECFPASTWTSNGVQDRIDFVYYSGSCVVEWSGHLDGSNSGTADWPSDHRAVLSILRMSEGPQVV